MTRLPPSRPARRLVAGAGVGVTAGVSALPAGAADHTVTASGMWFTPRTVTVSVGDSVTWHDVGGGPHDAGVQTFSLRLSPEERRAIRRRPESAVLQGHGVRARLGARRRGPRRPPVTLRA